MSETIAHQAGVPAKERGMQIQTVLAPIDFSSSSLEALRHAAIIAEPFDATILLLHVVKAGSPGYESSADLAALEEKTEHLAKEELRKLAERFVPPKIRLEIEIRFGWPFGGARPSEEIILCAARHSADMIVLGNHSRGFLDQVLLGSTAERVLRRAACPVLVVRTPDSAASGS